MTENLDLSNAEPTAEPQVESQAQPNEPVSTIPQEETQPEEITSEPTEEPKADSEDKGEELPKGLQKRLSKLTRQKYEQQARIQALEQEKQELLQRVRSSTKTREDFASEQDYLDHALEQKLQAKLGEANIDQQRQQLANQQVQIQQQMWAEKVEAAKAHIPDFYEVVGKADVPLSEDAIEFISESDVGPELAYELAKDVQVASDLMYMTPTQRQRALIRMEMQLSTQQRAAQAPAPITQAKATPKPATSGAGGVTTPDQMSMADFVKWRNKQLGR